MNSPLAKAIGLCIFTKIKPKNILVERQPRLVLNSIGHIRKYCVLNCLNRVKSRLQVNT